MRLRSRAPEHGADRPRRPRRASRPADLGVEGAGRGGRPHVPRPGHHGAGLQCCSSTASAGGGLSVWVTGGRSGPPGDLRPPTPRAVRCDDRAGGAGVAGASSARPRGAEARRDLGRHLRPAPGLGRRPRAALPSRCSAAWATSEAEGLLPEAEAPPTWWPWTAPSSTAGRSRAVGYVKTVGYLPAELDQPGWWLLAPGSAPRCSSPPACPVAVFVVPPPACRRRGPAWSAARWPPRARSPRPRRGPTGSRPPFSSPAQPHLGSRPPQNLHPIAGLRAGEPWRCLGDLAPLPRQLGGSIPVT